MFQLSAINVVRTASTFILSVTAGDRVTCAFFYMELEDSDGKLHYLPEQMVVNNGYPWADGIKPVLMQLLDGISLSEIADALSN